MKKIERFRNDAVLHNEVVNHLLAKKVPLNQANLFYQPETWEVITEKIINHEYHFQPLKEGYIDKRNGNPMTYAKASFRNFEDVRKIYMLCPMDRAVMHMIYLVYYPMYIGATSDKCVSYKRDLSTSKVGKVLSERMVKEDKYDGFKMDIHHYFDDVNMETIETVLDTMNDGDPLDSLLWEMYHDDRVLVNGELIHRHRGLIQGCAFACLLADLCLTDIDTECDKLDVIYYRYSDDIICLGNDTDKALDIIKCRLADKGLQIHPKKFSKINAKIDWFEFLGFKFKGDMIGVSEKTINNISYEIKKRTLYKSKELKRPMTEREVKKCIADLQYYFFTAFAKDRENFGMGVYLFGTVNIYHDYKELEIFCKDCLRACATGNTNIYGIGSVNDRKDYTITHGNGNGAKAMYEKGEDTSNVPHCAVTTNRLATQKGDWDLLKECGWISLIHMWKMYHTNINIYNAEVNRMANHVGYVE